MKPIPALLLATTATLSRAQTYKINPPDLAHVQCGDNNKLPTPTYGDQGIIFTICAQRTLQAPIQTVYDALLDFSRYSTWNSFVVNVQAPQSSRGGGSCPNLAPGPVLLGTKVTFTTQGLLQPFIHVNTSSDEVVTLDERDLLRNSDGDGTATVTAMMNGWRYDGFGQLAEHPNILTDLGGGMVRYVSYESYYGLLAPVTAVLKSNLKKQFEAQADDLKRYVEAM